MLACCTQIYIIVDLTRCQNKQSRCDRMRYNKKKCSETRLQKVLQDQSRAMTLGRRPNWQGDHWRNDLWLFLACHAHKRGRRNVAGKWKSRDCTMRIEWLSGVYGDWEARKSLHVTSACACNHTGDCGIKMNKRPRWRRWTLKHKWEVWRHECVVKGRIKDLEDGMPFVSLKLKVAVMWRFVTKCWCFRSEEVDWKRKGK